MDEWLLSTFGNCAEWPLITKYLIILLIGFMPVLEIRGAAIVGVCAFNLGIVETYIVGLIGNVLLILPLVLVGRRIIRWLETTKVLGWFGRFMSKRTAGKIDKVNAITNVALFFFVAVPIPGTGVCTGGLIASFMDLRLKKCFWSLALGAAVAGVISMLIYAWPIFAATHPGVAMPWFR